MGKASQSAQLQGPKCGACGAASRLKVGAPRWAKCENGHKLYTKKG